MGNCIEFSMVPLRMGAIAGAIIGALGTIGAIFIAIRRIMDPTIQMGWSSLMVAVLICSGAIIMFLGVLGEYLGRLFMTVNMSPQYVLKKVIDRRG